MATRTRGSASEHDARLKDFALPSVFTGDQDSYRSFWNWRHQVECYLTVQGLRDVLDNPIDATEAEKQYVSAVFSEVLDGPALDTAFASSREAAPGEVWATLRAMYEPSSHKAVDKVWSRVYRRKLHSAEAPRSLVNSLENQFAEIREITVVPPTEDEKRRVLIKILEERREYSEFLYKAYKDPNSNWISPCKDFEELHRLRGSNVDRPDRSTKSEPIVKEPREHRVLTMTAKKKKSNPKRIVCFGCKNFGHIRANCPEEQDKEENRPETRRFHA